MSDEPHLPIPEPGDEAVYQPKSQETLEAEATRPPFFSWFGWAVMCVLFATLITVAVNSWWTGDRTEKVSYDQQKLTLFITFATDPRNLLAGQIPAESAEQVREQVRSTLTDLRVGLLPDASKEPEAARLLLMVDRELGRPPEQAALQTLYASKSEADRAFADLYDDPKAEGDLAKALTAEEGFTRTLAETQAREARGEKDVRKKLMPTGRFLAVMASVSLMGMAICLGIFAAIAATYLIGAGKVQFLSGTIPVNDAEHAGHLALRTAIYLLMLNVLGYLVSTALGDWLPDGIVAAISLLVVAAGIMVMSELRLGLSRVSLRTLFGETKSWPKLVGIGVFGYLATLPFALGLMLLGSQAIKFGPAPSHPIQEMLGPSAGVASLIGLFITAAVLAPLTEEMGFRGFLLSALRYRMGPLAAAVVNGLLFAAIHPQGPAMWLSLAAIGTGASLVTLATRSLIPAIVLHAIHNGLIMCLALSLSG